MASRRADRNDQAHLDGRRPGRLPVGSSAKSIYRRSVDMRTKLVFAMAAVTIGCLVTFGAVLYGVADRIVGTGTADRMNALAESGLRALDGIVDGWEERVKLIASRTQLRVSLRDFEAEGDSSSIRRVEQILEDAATAVTTVSALGVYDRTGRLLARAGVMSDSVPLRLSARSTAGTDGEVHFPGVTPPEDGPPRVSATMPLTLDGKRVGYLFVLLNGNRLVALTSDYTGLGETGELMIVVPDTDGARTLHPVRFPPDLSEPAASVRLTQPDDPSLLALAGTNAVRREGLHDYRGRVVWAATRYLPDMGWGLVVKLDADEKRAVVLEFREEMTKLALSLAGIGLLAALLLGLRFAAPIHDLAKVAEKFGAGELDARATIRREDEIGLLARTFNETADALQERMAELHEYHKLFEVSYDLMCIAGTDGYFKLTNPAFTRVLGWTEEQLTTRPFLDLVHPEDKEATQHEIDKLAEGQPTISFVNRFRTVDGTWKYLKWNSYPETESGLLYAIARETRTPTDD